MSLSGEINWNAYKTQPKQTQQGTTSFALPPGEYLVEISSMEPRESRDQMSEYVEAKLVVLGPEKHKNRMFYNKFFTRHDKSPKIVEICMKQLEEISNAALNKLFHNVSELVGCKARLILEIKPGSPKKDGTGMYPDSNKIIKILSIVNGTDTQKLPTPPQNNSVYQTPQKRDEVVEFDEDEHLPF
jgi:hypothetical protein